MNLYWLPSAAGTNQLPAIKYPQVCPVLSENSIQLKRSWSQPRNSSKLKRGKCQNARSKHGESEGRISSTKNKHNEISLFLEESHCHSRQEHSRGSLWLCHGVQAWMWSRVCPSSVTHSPSSPPCNHSLTLHIPSASTTSQDCKQFMEEELLKLFGVLLRFKWKQCLLLMGNFLLGLYNKHLEMFWECQSSWSCFNS